jgi:rubrerythrin
VHGEKMSPEQIRAAYRRRHGRHVLLMFLWVAYCIGLLWSNVVPDDMKAWFLFGGVVGFGAVAMVNWRCPNCGYQFGRTLSESECPACHAQFQEGAWPGAAA